MKQNDVLTTLFEEKLMSSKANIKSQTVDYFNKKFKEHGATPKGVDWNGDVSQHIRFEQLLRIIPYTTNLKNVLSLNDLGCGYGALVDYIQQQNPKLKIDYYGYDVSSMLVDSAKSKFNAVVGIKINFEVISNSNEMKVSDYSVASGIFNKRLDFTEDEWREYILATLHSLNDKSLKGFAFNMLTSYSDLDKRKPDLFYADPCWFFDYCKTHFSRQVSLLHDYGIYDFTILVRKESNAE